MSEALLAAIRSGDLDAVRRLATPESVRAADAEGRTPLMHAARLGRTEMIAPLVAAGAEIEAADAQRFTALFHACYNGDEDRGHAETVQALLDAGADKEARIGYGVRPLMYAAGNGETAVVEVLLKAGADAVARNEGGRTALMMVKDRDYVDVINLLHEAELALGGEGCGTRNAPGMQVVTFLKKAH